MEPADGMQWRFRQAQRQLELTASPIKYLNRASVLEDPRTRALLENSGRVSIPASLAMPINSAAELFAAAYRAPNLAVSPMKWGNSPAALDDSWPRALLANTAPPSISAQIRMPINEAVTPVEHG